MSSINESQNTGVVLKSASITFTGLVYQLGISFLSGMVVARLIGPAQFGIFNIARNLVESISVFTKAGFDIGIVRYLGENSDPEHNKSNAVFLKYVLAAVLVLSLIPVVGIILGGKFFLSAYVRQYPDFTLVMSVMALSIPLMSLTNVLGGAFRGMLQIRPRIVAEYFLQPTTRLIIIFLLFFVGWRLWAAVTGTVLSFVIAIGYLLITARCSIFAGSQDVDSCRVDRKPLQKLYEVGKYSIVISLTVSVATLLQKVDVLMLGHYAAAEQVGQYAVVQMTVTLIVLSNSALNQAIAPMIARLFKEGNRAEMRRLIHQHTRWVMISSLPVFLVIGFLGKYLITIFGKGYGVATAPIALLALSQLVVAVFSSAGFMLSMTGKHMTEFFTMLVALVCNVVLNVVLIPRYGITGASLATLLAVIVANFLRSFQVYRVHGIFPLGKEVLGPVFLGSGCFIAVVGAARVLDIPGNILTSILIAGVYFVAYVLLIIKFGLADDDRILYSKLKRRIGFQVAD